MKIICKDDTSTLLKGEAIIVPNTKRTFVWKPPYIELSRTAVFRDKDSTPEEDFYNLTGLRIEYVGMCKYQFVKGEDAMAFALKY